MENELIVVYRAEVGFCPGSRLELSSPTGTGETPTLGTLDFYMAKLHSAIESNPVQHERLVVRVKEILSRIAR